MDNRSLPFSYCVTDTIRMFYIRVGGTPVITKINKYTMDQNKIIVTFIYAYSIYTLYNNKYYTRQNIVVLVHIVDKCRTKQFTSECPIRICI